MISKANRCITPCRSIQGSPVREKRLKCDNDIQFTESFGRVSLITPNFIDVSM